MKHTRRLTVVAAIATIAAGVVAVPATAQAQTPAQSPASASTPATSATQPIAISSGNRYVAGETTVTGTAAPGADLLIAYQASFGTRYTDATVGADGTWSADVFLEVPSSTSTSFFTVSSVGGSGDRLAARFTVVAPTVDSAYVPAALDWKFPVYNSHGTRSGTGTPGAFLTLSWGFASASTIVAPDGTWTVDVSTAPST